MAVLDAISRQGLTKKVIFEQRPENQRGLWRYRGIAFKTEQIASAKTLRWKRVSCVRKTVSREETMWLELI